MRIVFKLVLALLAILLLRSCFYAVDAGEFVYVTQFGRHVATYDGGQPDEAGLHLKWPWPIETLQRIDRRLQYLDLPGAELLTGERGQRKSVDQTIIVDAYLCWRISTRDDVDRFVRKVGSVAGARALLDRDINGALGAIVGTMQLSDLISIDPGKVDRQRELIRERLLSTALREKARNDYGIELVEFRLRRSNHPASVRPAIFARIISERDRKSAEHESTGERLAAEIRSQTDLDVGKMKASAEGQAIEARGRADAGADRILNETQLRRPEFYAFLKELEDLKSMLATGKTILLLSTKRFKTLTEPPVLPEGR